MNSVSSFFLHWIWIGFFQIRGAPVSKIILFFSVNSFLKFVLLLTFLIIGTPYFKEYYQYSSVLSNSHRWTQYMYICVWILFCEFSLKYKYISFFVDNELGHGLRDAKTFLWNPSVNGGDLPIIWDLLVVSLEFGRAPSSFLAADITCLWDYTRLSDTVFVID